jgi:LPXTG-motif cell wall-anchored protein
VLTCKVSRVVKGAVGERQEIVTPGGGEAGCGGFGIGLSGPGPFLVYAFGSAGDMYELQPGQYASNLCSGSRAIADGGAPATGGTTPTQLATAVGLLAAVAAAGLTALRARRRSSPG